MPKRKLTHPFISSLEPPEKRTEIFDSLASGLALRISPTGHKSFVYRYRFGDLVRRYTIGTFGMISLADARREAENLHLKVKKGIDPQVEKKKRRNKPKAETIGDLAALFIKKHLPKLKPSTRKSYTARIDSEILPALKDIAIKELQRIDVIELLDEIAFEQNEPVNSNRVRAILSSMFSFGVQRGMADYNLIKTIKPLGKESSRDRVYEEFEIATLWEAFENQPEPGQSIFKILLLCGQRKTETSKMRWEDIEGNSWKIPKEHAKSGRPHYVPLSDIALNVIKSLYPLTGRTPYVFASMKKQGEPCLSLGSAVERVRSESGVSDFRIHDLRRTAATYLAELGTDRTILGKVLNHKGMAGDNQVTARYDRYDYMDEKRAALTQWSKKLMEILPGDPDEIEVKEAG